MPDMAMDLGDLPAWIALVVSGWTAYRQGEITAKAEQARIGSEAEAKQQRESDQKRLRIEQIQRDVEDLSALATDYWMRPGSDNGSSGVLINSKIRDISSRINRYGLFLWSSANQDFLTFKQAVTGGSFQSSKREAEKHTSETIRKISSASMALKDKFRVELDKIDMPSKY